MYHTVSEATDIISGRRLNYTDIIPLSDYVDMFDMAAYHIERRYARDPEVKNPDTVYHHTVTGKKKRYRGRDNYMHTYLLFYKDVDQSCKKESLTNFTMDVIHYKLYRLF